MKRLRRGHPKKALKAISLRTKVFLIINLLVLLGVLVPWWLSSLSLVFLLFIFYNEGPRRFL